MLCLDSCPQPLVNLLPCATVVTIPTWSPGLTRPHGSRVFGRVVSASNCVKGHNITNGNENITIPACYFVARWGNRMCLRQEQIATTHGAPPRSQPTCVATMPEPRGRARGTMGAPRCGCPPGRRCHSSHGPPEVGAPAGRRRRARKLGDAVVFQRGPTRSRSARPRGCRRQTPNVAGSPANGGRAGGPEGEYRHGVGRERAARVRMAAGGAICVPLAVIARRTELSEGRRSNPVLDAAADRPVEPPRTLPPADPANGGY